MSTMQPSTPSNQSTFKKLINRLRTPPAVNSNNSQNYQNSSSNTSSSSLHQRPVSHGSSPIASTSTLASPSTGEVLQGPPQFESGDYLNEAWSPTKLAGDLGLTSALIPKGSFYSSTLSGRVMGSTTSFTSAISSSSRADSINPTHNNHAALRPTSGSSRYSPPPRNREPHANDSEMRRRADEGVGVSEGAAVMSSGGQSSASGSSAGASSSGYAVDSSGDRIQKGNFLRSKVNSKGDLGLKRSWNSREAISQDLGVDPGLEKVLTVEGGEISRAEVNYQLITHNHCI